ncbi:MAG: hypothetical protein IPO63_08500 [Bacteroidetes bacterium]|nr:hypothetical protein [Bacteroidota bacterium]
METTNKNLIVTIDAILNYLTAYWNREKKTNDAHEIQSELYNTHKFIDSKFFEHAIQIMEQEKYIIFIPVKGEINSIQKLEITVKGHLLYLNGGLTAKSELETNKNELYKYGQFAVIAAGVFASFECIEKFVDFLNWCTCMSNFFHWIYCFNY